MVTILCKYYFGPCTLSEVGCLGHTLHFKLDSNFLVRQNEILLNVIKAILLAADSGVFTHSVDSRQSVRYKIPIANEPLSQHTKNLCMEHPRWCINYKDLKNLQSQLIYIYGYVY